MLTKFMSKKKMKLFAMMLTFTLVLTSFSTIAFVNAAAKPKLSAKKVTVTAGKTKTLKVKGVKAKKIKKTTWSVKNKKIAKLSKKSKTKVTVKGIKKGSTKITAKVRIGKKTTTLKCNVKVNAKPKPKLVPITPVPPTPIPPTPVPPTDTPSSTPSESPSAPPSSTPSESPSAPPSEPPEARMVIVDFENDEVGTEYAYTEGDNPPPIVKVVEDPINVGGKSLQVTTNGHNKAAIVPIQLPYELQNYEAFSFDFYLLGGTDLEYKEVKVYVADNPATFVRWGFGNTSGANHFADNFLCQTATTSFTDAYKDKWTKFEIDITNPKDKIKDLSGDLYLAIGIHCTGADFLLDNLTFRLMEGFDPMPTPPLEPLSLDVSNSSLIFYEPFDGRDSDLYQVNNPDGPISGMSGGEEIPKEAGSSTSTGMYHGSAGRSGGGARLVSYNAEDYIQVVVKNTGSDKQTYLFAFCVRYNTSQNSTKVPDTLPLQVVSFPADTSEDKTVLKELSVKRGQGPAYWNDVIVPIIDVPANGTVNVQISQTMDISEEGNARICFDNFYLWSVDGGDPHDPANYTFFMEKGRKGEIDITLGDDETVTWSSNDIAIATVDENGVVTAISAGQTFVIAEIKKEDAIVDKKVCMIEVK